MENWLGKAHNITEEPSDAQPEMSGFSRPEAGFDSLTTQEETK